MIEGCVSLNPFFKKFPLYASACLCVCVNSGVRASLKPYPVLAISFFHVISLHARRLIYILKIRGSVFSSILYYLLFFLSFF